MPNCPFWPKLIKPKCGPDSPEGEWCQGDGTCGTDNPANKCFLVEEVYYRIDCDLIPPSPPPPLPPRSPSPPNDSAYLPAPPPPADLSGLDQSLETPDDSILGPLNLPLLIVIIVLAICIPCLIVVLFWYCCPGRCMCRKEPDAKAVPPPAEPNSLGYGGTLVVDDGTVPPETNIDRL